MNWLTDLLWSLDERNPLSHVFAYGLFTTAAALAWIAIERHDDWWPYLAAAALLTAALGFALIHLGNALERPHRLPRTKTTPRDE